MSDFLGGEDFEALKKMIAGDRFTAKLKKSIEVGRQNIGGSKLTKHRLKNLIAGKWFVNISSMAA